MHLTIMRRILLLMFAVVAATRCAVAPPALDTVPDQDEGLRDFAHPWGPSEGPQTPRRGTAGFQSEPRLPRREFDPGHPWTTRFGYPLANLIDLGAEFWILFGTVGQVDPVDECAQ
jgi:hypothetical protein